MEQLSSQWFVKVRGSYLPKSWQGWLMYLPYMAYVIGAFVYVIANSYSLWQAIFFLVPNWVAALVIMTWVAAGKTHA